MDMLSITSLREVILPELAMAIRESAGRVLERWGEAVKQSLPCADELTRAQLRDDIPPLLSQLAILLQTNLEHAEDMFEAHALSHGTARFHQSYNLSELLIEAELLRRVLLEEVLRYLERPLTGQEIVALNMGVDATIRRSVLAFVRDQTSEIQAVNEAQSKYLSFLSHDLRGGLNGVLLMLEVLRRQLRGHDQFADSLADLDVMKRSILETVGTMDRFLHAERFRKGKVLVKPAILKLGDLIPELVGQFSYHAKDKGVELTTHLAPDCSVFSDRAILNLILQNLISNAIKFSKRGKVTIVASMRANTAMRACRISIIDEGPGIDKERLATLFAPFTQGETHGQAGVGLGLSIARQAAELLKAKLWAESEPGKGATFVVEVCDFAGRDGKGE